MDHLNERGTKHQDRCGCSGAHSAKQDSVSQPHSHDEGRSASAALDILDERFARGEIDKAEYVEKKQLISQRVTPPKGDLPGQDQMPVAAKDA